MNKVSKSLIVLFLAFLMGSSFGVYSIQAQDDKLVLEVIEDKECDIQYTGENCVADLKLTNNTGEILGGEASLHIDYKGICGDGFFDGEGIDAQFSITSDNWLNFSGWQDGTTAISDFNIPKGETLSKLKIETVPNLCPGEYVFTFTLKGTTGTGKEYKTMPSIIGGSGGALPQGRIIYNEKEGFIATSSVTVTWQTSYFSTSQVIYGTTPNQFNFNAGPEKYGYEFVTTENTDKVSVHSMVLMGLTPGTIYYYRCVSHASPATISQNEHSFTTLGMAPTPTPTPGPTLAPIPTPGPGSEPEPSPETGPVTEPTPGPGPSPDDSVEPSPASTVTEPEVAGFFPNLFAAAGSIFGNFWNTCYPCLPWWLILVFAGYCLLQGLLSKKKDKEKLVKWLILGICLAILAIIFYLVNYRCVAIWLLLLLVSLIFILWRLWIVSEKNLVWPEHKETENLLKKTKKDKVLLLGIIVLLILFIIYCILECLHPWVITTAFILFVLGVNLIKKKQK